MARDHGGRRRAGGRRARRRLAATTRPGPGQYEIDLAPLAPAGARRRPGARPSRGARAAADAGLLATFMARPLEGQAGSGLHLHQRRRRAASTRAAGSPTTGGPSSPGMLTHARALAALASPTVNSYKRLHAGPEAPERGRLGPRQPGRASGVGIGGRRRRSSTAAPTRRPTRTCWSPGCWRRRPTAWPTPSTRARRSRRRSTATTRRHGRRALPAAAPQPRRGARRAARRRRVRRRLRPPPAHATWSTGGAAEAEAYRAHVTAWELDRYLDGLT